MVAVLRPAWLRDLSLSKGRTLGIRPSRWAYFGHDPKKQFGRERKPE